MKRRIFVILIPVVAITVLTGVIVWLKQPTVGPTPFVNNTALQTLPIETGSTIDTSHLADGLIPPTNKWFSGLALQAKPRTVYPSPLSFAATETGFSFSLPKVQVGADSINSVADEPVTVSIAGASAYQIIRYDELSVELSYQHDGDELARVMLVAGSPYIQLTAKRSIKVNITATNAALHVASSVLTTTSASRTYGAAGFGQLSLAAGAATASATVSADSLLTFFGLPAGQPVAELLRYAGNRITGTNVSYAADGTAYQTDLMIRTANNQPTLLGMLPHQTFVRSTDTDSNRSAGSAATVRYATIYGAQSLHAGQQFSFTTASIDLDKSLDLSHLTASEKAELIKTVRQDINASQFTANDTYFGGKELYRAAQLLQLAQQLGQPQIATTMQQKLQRELADWLSVTDDSTKKYFYYDAGLHSVVGQAVAFGSQDINDHHFHYGYFIYAAAILARYDKQFVTTYGAQVDLLVADIANYRPDEALPLRRVFDPYFGHSWASGSSPFDSGNNQESVSEALNAWIAVGLWAKQSNNQPLSLEAGWMASNETAAAKAYWLGIDTTQAPYKDGYRHSLVSLNWGGKRDYATFFSDQPNAKLGIQLIPLSPAMAAIIPKASVVQAQLVETTTSDPVAQFSDYLLMYQAVHSQQNLLPKALALPDAAIDSANSRAYLMAWVLAAQSSR